MNSSGNSTAWFVLRVKANAERRVAEALTGRGVEVFLPMQKRQSRQRGRGSIDVPLFAGYLFAQFDPRAMLPVLVCPGVVCVLCRGNTPEAVDAGEMRALQTLVASNLEIEPLPMFTTGQRVKFSRGPLTDLDAVVVKDSHRSTVVVSISLLRRSVCAEVDREWLHGSTTEVPIHLTHWLPATA
jgi:transcription antitermination factor NusG